VPLLETSGSDPAAPSAQHLPKLEINPCWGLWNAMKILLEALLLALLTM
jgi:hypothetical protein